MNLIEVINLELNVEFFLLSHIAADSLLGCD